jgi:heme-degrading monooxygenase HmoA
MEPGKERVMPSEHYASGDWRVKEGSGEEFIARWRAWINKSTEPVEGFGSARLLQDSGDARHFVSISRPLNLAGE